jgi:ribonuclease P protein component|tara:strand:+ start:1029 stop:1370 length:342 start_codon:yes stop_codon:yes gene_type:complete
LRLPTLNKSSEFQKVKKSGKFYPSRCFNGYFLVDEEISENTYGIVVSKRVGNAVIRNHTKRRVREAIRASLVLKSTKNLKLVLILKKNVLDLAFIDLKSDIDKFFSKANGTHK